MQTRQGSAWNGVMVIRPKCFRSTMLFGDEKAWLPRKAVRLAISPIAGATCWFNRCRQTAAESGSGSGSGRADAEMVGRRRQRGMGGGGESAGDMPAASISGSHTVSGPASRPAPSQARTLQNADSSARQRSRPAEPTLFGAFDAAFGTSEALGAAGAAVLVHDNDGGGGGGLGGTVHWRRRLRGGRRLQQLVRAARGVRHRCPVAGTLTQRHTPTQAARHQHTSTVHGLRRGAVAASAPTEPLRRHRRCRRSRPPGRQRAAGHQPSSPMPRAAIRRGEQGTNPS